MPLLDEASHHRIPQHEYHRVPDYRGLGHQQGRQGAQGRNGLQGGVNVENIEIWRSGYLRVAENICDGHGSVGGPAEDKHQNHHHQLEGKGLQPLEESHRPQQFALFLHRLVLDISRREPRQPLGNLCKHRNPFVLFLKS